MVLGAIFLAVSKISAERHEDHGVAILPEMTYTPTSGLVVKNPVACHQVCLTGCADYTIIQYLRDEGDSDKRILLGGATPDDALAIATAHLLVAYAKRQSGEYNKLSRYMPEAVSQAISLGEATKQSEVRFCLSDGHSWIFAILQKDEAGNRTYYESAIKSFDGSLVRMANPTHAMNQIREIVELVLYWLSPSKAVNHEQLYELKHSAQFR
ncbi:hypothetical protein BOTBODRAFT_59856 [Botryobasidium botryosum FD-172 SS1]|uniref:Uncharacterized protein n=1 Tax=Botryobasidium botryosum (strain FD-172 SS1) TaxID=930990 RepID=A0A067LW78_BOTB1|nr:hypothetical protein BOTBODRAFT_59856 [Botryobasidium botryosum FD-172 SS1]